MLECSGISLNNASEFCYALSLLLWPVAVPVAVAVHVKSPNANHFTTEPPFNLYAQI